MPHATPAAALCHIGRKLGARDTAALPWGPPAIPDLIERIDAALKRHRSA